MHRRVDGWPIQALHLGLSGAGATTATITSFAYGDGTFVNDNEPYADWDYRFADMDINLESGTHHAQFRQYSDTQGRWMSPDPYDGSYDLSNPQSFNRYSYVLNNPLSFIDPLGLYATQPIPCGTDEDGNPVFCMSSGNGDGGDGGGGGGDGGSGWAPTPGGGPRRAPVLFLPPPSDGGGGGGWTPKTPVCYQGGCIIPGRPPLITPAQMKKIAKAYLCGSSPAENIKNWTLEGAGKGLVVGAAEGGFTGTLLGTPVGGVIGAFAGGIVDGAVGGAAGAIWGSAASLACSLGGAY